MATRKLTIDKEFAGLCPDLTAEEAAHLEASIESDGCRDEIVVWANHKDTILDGHHRYEICERLGKPFKTTALTFDSREDCIEWIIANQLGRRNLTDEQKSYLRGKRYQAEKTAGHGAKSGDHSDTQISEGKTCPQVTAERLAEDYGVSPRTVKNDAAFAEAVDTIAEVAGPEAKAEILAGESPLGKAAVVKAAKLPKAKMAKAIKTGKLPTAKHETEDQKQAKKALAAIGVIARACDHFGEGDTHMKALGRMKDFFTAKAREANKAG